jgi:hypothetical protein
MIVTQLVDLVLAFVSAPPLFHDLDIMAPFWAIFGALGHLIFSFDLEIFLVLYWMCFLFGIWTFYGICSYVGSPLVMMALLGVVENCHTLIPFQC